MRYRFIEDHRREWPVRLMCRVLEVRPGGYCGWRGRPASARAQASEAIAGAIKEVHGEAKARHGGLRIHAELVAHSDCARPYAGEHYQRALAGHGIACSMSRRVNCWDNAPMESFFATLKKELVHDEDYQTRQEASLFEYIEVFYNRVHRHSALGYMSPIEYERAG